MAHIVVLGGGVGGWPAAYELRGALGKEHKVTVVHNSTHFSFTPSNPWVAVGWRKAEEIQLPMEGYLSKKGIHFISVACEEIKPDDNKLVLADGQIVDYDYLVICTGPELAFDEVEGLGPHGGYTQSVCSTPHAETACEGWEAFLKDPGPIVVGAVQGASCFGPAYEFAFIMDADLRKRRIRDQVPMTYVTSEPYIGHLGLAGVGDSRTMMESELRGHHINWICNAKVTRVEPGKMFVDEHDMSGNVVKQHELPHKYSMMLPAFRGVPAVAKVGDKLCNPRGFVKVDKHQRNTVWPNIYSAGVCVAIPPVEATPVPTGTPKTGYMIESMVTAIVHNIELDLQGKPLTHEGTWNAICLADMGDTGVAFVAMPQIGPRNVAWMRKGKWVHLAKVGFEKYFMRKMKTGSSEPMFEKFMLRMVGITRLKKDS
ncbi:sulfide-quinone oxidoreductase [Magnetococcus marinus MC-1]|uniref:Sulfide-quinone reductase n=1 Tax=Magnetococcus marinus (strain ATCC BAA-1437 / JCM 17883 / MC-1) TaxID=156889 RepID=A0LAF5_MAGMM|nr:FAD/NAD(P)-binding oxidoreductase [Magnetococcus marinus]ABK44948.1 sulfide-quinone oxidoreductase [Magnetococcus marinus MC-1]